MEESDSGVNTQLVILKGHRIKRPVHLYFGVIPEEWVQEIISSIMVEAGAYAELLAQHSTMPSG